MYGGGTFGYCRKLTSFNIQNEIAEITGNIFNSECECLNSFKINYSNSKYKIINGVLYSKDERKLYVYPPSKEEKFVVPEYVEELVSYSFYNNRNLVDIQIGSNVKKIGTSCFEACKKLKNVVLYSEVSGIISFWGCNNIEKIYIGNKIKTLGGSLFYNDKNIQEVKYDGTKEEWNNIQKNSDWNNNSNITKVICLDGEVDI